MLHALGLAQLIRIVPAARTPAEVAASDFELEAGLGAAEQSNNRGALGAVEAAPSKAATGEEVD